MNIKINKDIVIIVFIISMITFISMTPKINNESKIKEVRNKSDESIISIKIDFKIENQLIRQQYIRFINYGEKKFLVKYKKLLPVVKMIENILKENGLDPDLVFLAYIESEFTISARSHKNAVGLWQFTTYTGKELGLKINKSIDERKDIYKSTLAFIKHFKFLYQYYGSIDLALAAYNCGVGRVNKAIKQGKSRNFWELADKGFLPAETKYYVPKFYAIARWVNENKQQTLVSSPVNLVVTKVKKVSKIEELLNLKDKNIRNAFYKYNKHIYSNKLYYGTYIILPQDIFWRKNKNLSKLNIVYYFIPDIFQMKLNNILDRKSKSVSINENQSFSDYLKLTFLDVFNNNIKE